MNKIAVFTVADEEFGIEIDKITEIIKPLEVTSIPKVPTFIRGLINLRNDVVPLMDLRERLNVKPSPLKERIIIVKMRGEKIGLLVDSVKGIVNIKKEQIARPPSIFKGLKPEYLMGIGKIMGRLIIILNLDSLLTSEEMILLGECKEDLSRESL